MQVAVDYAPDVVGTQNVYIPAHHENDASIRVGRTRVACPDFPLFGVDAKRPFPPVLPLSLFPTPETTQPRSVRANRGKESCTLTARKQEGELKKL